MRRTTLSLLAIGVACQTYTATGPFNLKVISPAIYSDTYLSLREGYTGDITFTLLSAALDTSYYFNTTNNSTTGLGALYYPIAYPDDNGSSDVVEYSGGFELDPDSNIFPFEISTPLSLNISTSFGFSSSRELQVGGGAGYWVGCPQIQNQWILVSWYNGNGTLDDNSCIPITVIKEF